MIARRGGAMGLFARDARNDERPRDPVDPPQILAKQRQGRAAIDCAAFAQHRHFIEKIQDAQHGGLLGPRDAAEARAVIKKMFVGEAPAFPIADRIGLDVIQARIEHIKLAINRLARAQQIAFPPTHMEVGEDLRRGAPINPAQMKHRQRQGDHGDEIGREFRGAQPNAANLSLHHPDPFGAPLRGRERADHDDRRQRQQGESHPAEQAARRPHQPPDARRPRAASILELGHAALPLARSLRASGRLGRVVLKRC